MGIAPWMLVVAGVSGLVGVLVWHWIRRSQFVSTLLLLVMGGVLSALAYRFDGQLRQTSFTMHQMVVGLIIFVFGLAVFRLLPSFLSREE